MTRLPDAGDRGTVTELLSAWSAGDPEAQRLARNQRTYEITLADGTKMRRTSSDPGRVLLTGFVAGPAPLDDWQKFDVNGLRGIRKTAPYFHNNSAATLEEVVDHYVAFFKRVKAIQVPGAPIPPVARTDGELRQRAETRGARSIARVPSETVGRPAYDMCPTQLLSVVTTR